MNNWATPIERGANPHSLFLINYSLFIIPKLKYKPARSARQTNIKQWEELLSTVKLQK